MPAFNRIRVAKSLFYLAILGGLCWQLFWILKPQPELKPRPELKPPELHLASASFQEMPAWQKTDLSASFKAFEVSCHAFLKQAPAKVVGSKFIPLTAQDWYPACNAAKKIHNPTNQQIRDFFETWFHPVVFEKKRLIKGLFTGYYMPLLRGSLTKTKHYSTPLYSLPTNLLTAKLASFVAELTPKILVGRIKGKQFIPYYSRAEIDHGAIDGVARVIAWVEHPFDRLTLEIEGSGIIKLTDNSRLVLGYAGENGAAYTAIAAVLIRNGDMTRDNASMQNIRKYLDSHSDRMMEILHQNKSFVFFNKQAGQEALGSQGVPLTDGYSLAVDRNWIPMGTPLWLSTTRPDEKLPVQKPFHRLMIAQDTGGAIRGPVRGDVYWGAGERATEIAGKMKNPGYYWLLLPNHVETA